LKGEHESSPHFAWEEVGKHDQKDDLWVVVEGGVYNLTKFVDKHPGGSRVIALRAGRKADEAFISGNHPPKVREKTLLQYRIGSVK
jgi:cytochrome b involved in lipid metabolism